MLFSERHGFKPVKSVIQRESMDADLQNGLWSAIYSFILSAPADSFLYSSDHKLFARRLWHRYFKLPVDTIPADWGTCRATLRNHYYYVASWSDAYDFVEFVVNEFPDENACAQAIRACNTILERELSAWRFVGKRLVEVTSDTEIAEIEQALAESPSGAQTHLQTALALLADKQSPDYRNSIKESISAVEAVVNDLAGARSTLGAGLKKLPTPLHPALESGLNKLYGWTSDAQGIRHALMEKPDLRFADAKFMLVACAAFVNYLLATESTNEVTS